MVQKKKLKPMKVSFVIPTLNEESGIGSVLEKIPKDLDCEVIVVDNGSTDRTVEIAKSLGARIIREKKKGYGSAYKTGFKHVGGEIIATLDGDDTYDPRDVKRLLKVMEEKKVEFVSGDRLKNLKKGSMTWLHVFGNNLISFSSNLMFGTNIHDSQSGMWVFYRDLLKRFNLEEAGMSLSSEIKLEAWKKARFVEEPISYYERKGKKTTNSFRQGFQIMRYLLKRWFSRA